MLQMNCMPNRMEEDCDEMNLMEMQDNYYDDRHLKQRSLLQAGFSQLEKTKDYVERHYFYQKTPQCS